MPGVVAGLERPLPLKLGTHNFQLVPREWLGGQEPHDVQPIEFLAPQISSTAELTYADISRQVEVAFAQDNFVGGIADNLRFALERNTKFRYSKGVDTSFPGFAYCGPKMRTLGAVIDTKPTKAVQRGNITYLAAGTKLYQITDSATRTLDTTFGNAITDMMVWGGFLIVAFGDAIAIQYRASDTSAGAFTSMAQNGKFLAKVGSQIWRGITNPCAIYSSDAVTGTWTQYDVGDTSFDLTGLMVLDGAVLVPLKTDGAYAFDADLQAIPLTPELELQADAQVGKVHAVFNRDGYFTSRLGVIQIVRGGGLANVGLERLADPGLPGSPPETRPTAMTTDGRFLYSLHVSGNGIYIYKLDFAGNWHNYLWRSDVGAGSDLLFATGKLGATSVNAILFAWASGANWQIAFANFPATYDPTQDPNYQFNDDAAGVMQLRSLDGTSSYPTIPKYADRVKSIGDSLTSARTVAIDAYADNEPAKALGTFNESPTAETGIEPITHNRISLQMTLKTDSPSVTPRFRAFHLSVVLTPPVVRLHTFVILAEARTPLNTGGRGLNSSAEIVEVLRKLQAARASLDCVDEDDRKFKAYISDIAERTLWRKAAAGWESTKSVTARLKEVARPT